jgi:hypothetical protein
LEEFKILQKQFTKINIFLKYFSQDSINQMNRTTKKIKSNVITFEKYKKQILGVEVVFYIIRFKTNKNLCKTHLTLKRKSDYIKKYVVKKTHFFKYLTKHKVFSKTLYKYDKNLTEKVIRLIDTREKYTYCLNKSTLVFATTRTTENKSKVKDFMTKHVMICKEDVCASGEMIIHKNKFIFNNASGTFRPSMSNLQSIKKALPFLNIQIKDMKSNPSFDELLQI